MRVENFTEGILVQVYPDPVEPICLEGARGKVIRRDAEDTQPKAQFIELERDVIPWAEVIYSEPARCRLVIARNESGRPTVTGLAPEGP